MAPVDEIISIIDFDMIVAFIFIAMAVYTFIHNEIVCANREREFEEFQDKFKKEHPNLQYFDEP